MFLKQCKNTKKLKSTLFGLNNAPYSKLNTESIQSYTKLMILIIYSNSEHVAQILRKTGPFKEKKL